MQNYGVTPLVGGSTPGIFAPDILYMTSNGKFVLNDETVPILNITHPIHQLTVYTDSVIDGIIVTYNLEGGSSTLDQWHGSALDTPNVILFGENEILSAVYGRAGYYSAYQRDLIGNIAFVIFDTKTENARTVGPFGDADGIGEGQPFWASDVIAFGSFGTSNLDIGLSGLWFFNNPGSLNVSMDTTVIPVSKSGD